LVTVLPKKLAEVAAALPVPRRPALLLVVLLLSVGTQSIVALTGHALFTSVDSSVALADSLVLVPVALIALYFPATVAGLGVREAAFVYLFEGVGVSSTDATAASIAFLAVQLVVALLGGVVHMAWPIEGEQS
jgi:uncharacterized membrane protein YbhN (UPF0104 family)